MTSEQRAAGRHLVPVDQADERSAAERLWTLEQQEAIRRQLVPSVSGRPMAVSDADLALFGEVCARTELDPFLRQIYLIPTREGPRIHVGVDGHRLIAARAGLDSTDGPYWCGKDGAWTDVWLGDAEGGQAPPVAARYGVRRRGSRGTIYAVALYREFKGSGPNWTERPAHMLALVAERHALRKAFQAEFAGVARTVRDRGAELASQEPAEEPELEHWEAPRGRLVDEDTGELLDVAPTQAEDEGHAGPTREEALARFREAARRAKALRLGFDVPNRSAPTGELVDATVALEDRIVEAELAGVPVDRSGASGGRG